jgi:hypothetical protein
MYITMQIQSNVDHKERGCDSLDITFVRTNAVVLSGRRKTAISLTFMRWAVNFADIL